MGKKPGKRLRSLKASCHGPLLTAHSACLLFDTAGTKTIKRYLAGALEHTHGNCHQHRLVASYVTSGIMHLTELRLELASGATHAGAIHAKCAQNRSTASTWAPITKANVKAVKCFLVSRAAHDPDTVGACRQVISSLTRPWKCSSTQSLPANPDPSRSGHGADVPAGCNEYPFIVRHVDCIVNVESSSQPGGCDELYFLNVRGTEIRSWRQVLITC